MEIWLCMMYVCGICIYSGELFFLLKARLGPRWGSYQQVSTCLHRAFGFGAEAVPAAQRLRLKHRAHLEVHGSYKQAKIVLLTRM